MIEMMKISSKVAFRRATTSSFIGVLDADRGVALGGISGDVSGKILACH